MKSCHFGYRRLAVVAAIFASVASCEPGEAGDDVASTSEALGSVSGNRPLVTLLTTALGATITYKHDAGYYKNLLFRAKTPQFPNIQDYFSEESRGRFTFTNAGIYGPVQSLVQTDSDRFAEDIHLLESSGFQFSKYDANHDNQVDNTELEIVAVDNITATGGTNRNGGCVTLNKSSLQVCARIASVGEETDFWTLAHEISHSQGTLDLYGIWNKECFSNKLTLMSCEPGVVDDKSIIYHDPWHRSRMGWISPVTKTGKGSVELGDETWRTKTGSHSQPARFDNSAANSNEYFLFEFRGGRGYDRNVADVGIVAWHVKEDGSGNPFDNGGKDVGGHNIYAVSPDNSYGGSKAWKPENGRFQVAWKDGTVLPYSFWVEQPGDTFAAQILHWSQAPANNRPPTVKIVKPADGSSGPYGHPFPVTFQATVVDSRGSTNGTTVQWSSDVDGRLGTGTTISYTFLSKGTRTITATGKDKYGGVASASIKYTTYDAGPSARIDAPIAGATFFRNEPIRLSGNGSTATDFALPCDHLTWTIDRQPSWGLNDCGGMPSFNFTGAVTFTLTVHDDEGLTASTSVQVTLAEPPSPPVVTILSPAANMRIANWIPVHLSGLVQDSQGGPVTYRWTVVNPADNQETQISTQSAFDWLPISLFPGNEWIEFRLYGSNSHGQTTMAKQSNFVDAQPQ